MKLRSWLLSIGVLCCTALIVGQAYGDDKKDEKKPEAKKEAPPPAGEKKPEAPKDPKAAGGDKKPEAKDAKGGAPAAPSMDDPMMKAMMPGAEHAKLKALDGNWNYTAKMYWDPSGPMESKGTIERKWVMGGRYMKEDVKGPAMIPGMPEFEGLGYFGYDNVQKKYIGTWVDNMGTGVMNLVGDMDSAGKVLTMTATHWDPMTGKESKEKHVLTITDDKSHNMKMYGAGPDGKEMVMFDMTCTKK